MEDDSEATETIHSSPAGLTPVRQRHSQPEASVAWLTAT